MNNTKVALITGASRGIGASTALQLAAKGTDVIINFRSKGSRAAAVADEVRAWGRRAFLAQADITDEQHLPQLIEAIKEAGHLDYLILNASGGLEKDKPTDYATQLNVVAQKRLVEQALPFMPEGGRIVFVTSHLAHFLSIRQVSDFYKPVAVSKKAGEEALRALIPALEKKGISLVVVSSDMVEGTITPKLMERANPGTIANRRQQSGRLPTSEELATAIADATLNFQLSSGDTIYVGNIHDRSPK